MMRAPAGLLALLASSIVLVSEAAQQPTFRAGVDLIEVDVSVVDDNGRPLADLRAPEFAVTIDGAPRKVVSAQFISLRPSPVERQRADQVPPDVFFSSNTDRAPVRLIVMAVDRESISFGEGRQAMRAAGRFLDRLNPSDKVAFLTVPQPGPLVDFTTNHALVRKALEATGGEGHRPQGVLNIGVYEAVALDQHSDAAVEGEVIGRFCGNLRFGSFEYQACVGAVRAEAGTIAQELRRRTDNSLRALESILDALGEVEGPKSLVWISEGLVIDGPGGELSELERLAAAARTTVNVIMLDAPLADASVREPSPSDRQDRDLQVRGLELLAAMTRGALFRVSQNAEAVFARMEEELSGYYLLGVESLVTDQDGRRHPIKVEVRRRGARVRARREFLLPPATATTNERPEERLLRLLRSPFATGDLPLRLATYVYQDAQQPKVRVLIATEIGAAANTPADLTIGYALLDRDGNVRGSGTQKAAIVPVDGLNGPILEHVGALLVDPGRYTLRLAVIDGSGRRGSVEHLLEAWQMSGVPFAVGDLLVTETPVTGGDDSLRPPVEARLSNGRLSAYMELYADEPALLNETEVLVEVVSTDSSPVRATGLGVLRAGTDVKRRTVSAVVPVGALPPGQYIARAVVMRGGEQLAQLARSFRVKSMPVAAAAPPPGGAPTTAPGVPARVVDRSPPPIPALLSPPPAFQREDLARRDVVAFFMDVLDKGRPALKAVTAQVRKGQLTGAGRRAFDTGDQMAAAFLRGLELFTQGQINQAATQFNAALSVEPEFAPASLYLGACYAAVGRDRDATTAWRRALLGPAKIPVVYRVLADALLRLGDPQQAVPPLREAFTTWPDDDQIRRQLAVAYASTLQDEAALIAIEPYLTRHPDDHEALLVALHAIYALQTSDTPPLADGEALRQMTQYAEAYVAANGPHGALVTSWVDALRKSPRD